MEPYEREILLEKIEREGRVGASVPDAIDLAGHVDGPPPDGYGPAERFELRDFVFAAKQGEVDAVAADRVVDALRRHRTAQVRRVEEEPMSVEEGRAIVEEVRGIDRALTAIDQPAGRSGIDDEAAQQERADQQRWLNFLKKVTGADDGDDRRRHG